MDSHWILLFHFPQPPPTVNQTGFSEFVQDSVHKTPFLHMNKCTQRRTFPKLHKLQKYLLTKHKVVSDDINSSFGYSILNRTMKKLNWMGWKKQAEKDLLLLHFQLLLITPSGSRFLCSKINFVLKSHVFNTVWPLESKVILRENT